MTGSEMAGEVTNFAAGLTLMSAIPSPRAPVSSTSTSRLTILNPEFTPSHNAAPRIFNGIKDQVVTRLANNPASANQFLYKSDLQLLQDAPQMAYAVEGSVVERAIAQEIASFGPHRQMFQWTKNVPELNRPGMSIWDFTGVGPAQGHIFEVTTAGRLAGHESRWYGDLVNFSLYQWP